MFTAKYTFRELQTPNELEAMFRLRFREFSKLPWYDKYLKDCQNGLDIDAFDVRSRHFGLFKADFFGKEILIGGLRIILDEENPDIARLLEHRGWASNLKATDPARFLFHAYFGDADQLLGFGQGAPKTVCEPSRLILDSRFRSFGLANFIGKSITIAICSLPISGAVVTGRDFLVPLYRRMGFEVIGQKTEPHLPTYFLLKMDREKAAAIVPNLAQKVAEWQENPIISTKMGRFQSADLRFLWKKCRAAFLKKIPKFTVTVPSPQVQIAN